MCERERERRVFLCWSCVRVRARARGLFGFLGEEDASCVPSAHPRRRARPPSPSPRSLSLTHHSLVDVVLAHRVLDVARLFRLGPHAVELGDLDRHVAQARQVERLFCFLGGGSYVAKQFLTLNIENSVFAQKYELCVFNCKKHMISKI